MSAPGSKKNKPSSKALPAEEPVVVYPAVAHSLDYRLRGLLDTPVKKHKGSNETDLITLIRNGVSKKSLDHLIEAIGYSITDIATILHVSDRHLRRFEPDEKLNTEQSERLVEIARLYAKGEQVLGSIITFNEWMNAPVLALGNLTPKSLLDTSMGIQLLMNELGRIEHGVFA